MEKNKLANKTNFYLYIAVIIGFIAVFNYLANKKFFRIDLTDEKVYTISNETKKIIKNLGDLVTIEVYISEKNLPPLAINMTKRIKDMLSEYEAYSSGNLNVRYFDPTENPEIKQKARSLGLQEVPMQIIEKDKQQNVMCFMGLAVLYADKKEMIPVLNNIENLEYDVTSRILKVTRNEVKKVGFYFGNGPHMFIPPRLKQQQQGGPDGAYNDIRKNLQEHFEIKEVKDLKKGEKIPSDISTLILAGPQSLDEREKFEIDQFLMKGGRLVALIDAVTINTERGLNASKQAHNTGDILSHYGAKVNQNIIADASHGNITYQVNYGGFALPVSQPYPFWVRIIKDGFNRNNPVVSGLDDMIFMWPSSVETTLKEDSVTSVNAISLISTTKYAKEQINNFDLNPRRQWNFKTGKHQKRDLAVVLNGEFESFYKDKSIPEIRAEQDSVVEEAKKDDKSRKIIAKSPKTSVVVIGDSDFITDGSPGQNYVFMANLVEWLTLGDNLIGIRSKSLRDKSIDPNVDTGLKQTIKVFNIVIMPLLVILLGVFIFIKRRRIMKKGEVS